MELVCDQNERELGTKDRLAEGRLLRGKQADLCRAAGYRLIDATEASSRRDEIDVGRSPNMIIQQQREGQLIAMVVVEVVGGAKGNGQ